MKSISAVALSSLALATMSSAIHLPMQRVRPRSGASSTPMKKTGGTGLDNTQNILYTADVTVGGKTYTLQLDTGSSDLWFAPDKDTNQTFAAAQIYEPLQVNLTYGTGWSAGSVAQIDVDFAGFSIKNQTFLFVTELAQWDIDFEQQFPLYQGIAGLSFDTLSRVNEVVVQATNDTWGRSLMSNIFLSDPSTPNHIAFFLDRTGDLNTTDTGLFDIGTYAAGYESVADQPKHEVYSGSTLGVDRWNVLVDGISINGTKQTLTSSIVADNSTGISVAPPAGSISALMDTGTSAAQIPEAVFKALYEGMGAVLINGTTKYVVPCLAEANLEITIGNQTVVVHPLDLTDVQAYDDVIPGQNVTACTSAYEPGDHEGGSLDIILGDAFLRNVYAVYNYGDFVKTESGLSAGTPFIQILPLTDAQKASAEFKEARAKELASLPPQIDVTTINDPVPKTVSSSGSSSGTSSGNTGTGSGNTGAGSNLSSNLSNDVLSSSSTDDASALASLKTLTNLAPIVLGLLCASVGLLLILIVVVGVAFTRLSKQKAMPTRAGGAYVPIALERERAGEYKDEAVKYDTPFRD